jgi:hypothetical protein
MSVTPRALKHIMRGVLDHQAPCGLEFWRWDSDSVALASPSAHGAFIESIVVHETDSLKSASLTVDGGVRVVMCAPTPEGGPKPRHEVQGHRRRDCVRRGVKISHEGVAGVLRGRQGV